MKRFLNKKTLKKVFTIDFLMFAGTGWGYSQLGIREVNAFTYFVSGMLLPMVMGMATLLLLLPIFPQTQFSGSTVAIALSILWSIARAALITIFAGYALAIPARWLVFQVAWPKFSFLGKIFMSLLGDVWGRIPDDPYSKEKNKREEGTVQGLRVVYESDEIEDDQSLFPRHLRK
jgi:hypothetical protein